jgi:hypothetical protein
MMYVEQWRLTDELLVRRFRQECAGARVGDGYDRLKVATPLGVVHGCVGTVKSSGRRSGLK